MRLSRKLALGAAAGVVPLLVGQSPAAAVAKSDTEELNTIYTSADGSRQTSCTITARHIVDTTEDHVSAVLDTSDPCRAFLGIRAQYVDSSGATRALSADASDTRLVGTSVEGVGGTAVTVDYLVVFSDCSANCSHTLQTQTK